MLTVSVDLSGFEADLTDLEKRQVPFATSRMLNAMALAGQEAERKHMGEVMTLRRTDWDLKSIKITHFAKKTELSATIAVSPPGNAGKTDILAKFEDDTEKSSRFGHLIAIPIGTSIRRTKSDIIQQRDRPKSFNFRQVGNRILGDRGTFIVQTKNGRTLILQRTRQGVRALYLLVPRVAIKPNLAFEDTVGRAALAAADQAWEDAWTRAISTAK